MPETLNAATLKPRATTRACQARRPAVDAVGGVSYTSVPLAVRASEEYGYVKRDIRRITMVGGFLIGILVVLEILVNGAHLFTL